MGLAWSPRSGDARYTTPPAADTHSSRDSTGTTARAALDVEAVVLVVVVVAAAVGGAAVLGW